jgi:hypothetical protein
MSIEDHDDADDADVAAVDAALARLPERAPPAGFADRVMAGRPAPLRRRPWARLAVGGVFAAVAAAAVVVVVVGDGSAAGHVVAADRVSVDVGAAVVVAEVGARFSYDNDVVTLDAGDVFVRADGPLSVRTPAGVVDVTGTCFSLSLVPQRPPGAPMSATTITTNPRATGAIGAVAGAALVLGITVFEGSVRVHNAHGDVAVAAGQSAQMTAHTAPAPTAQSTTATTATTAEQEARAARVRALAAQSAQALDANVGEDAAALAAENKRLRALVAKQDEELALSDQDRVDREGLPLPFPKDLPARHTERGLVDAFTQAFAATGVDGNVTAVDCAEYPCIVWGEMKGDTSEMINQLKESEAFHDLYGNDSVHVRGWGHVKGKPELFAVTLLQKGEGAPDKDAVQKRVQRRTEAGFEANKPAAWLAGDEADAD